MKSAIFCMEPLEGNFPGYTNGDTWNGWECPFFTYDEAVKVLNASKRNGYSWRYDEMDDTFVVWSEDSYTEEFAADLIETPDGKIEIVYPIGTYCWIWELAA